MTALIDRDAQVSYTEKEDTLLIGPAPKIQSGADVLTTLARARALADLAAMLCSHDRQHSKHCQSLAEATSLEAAILTETARCAIESGRCNRLRADSMPARLHEALAALEELFEEGSEEDHINTAPGLMREVISPLRAALEAEADDAA